MACAELLDECSETRPQERFETIASVTLAPARSDILQSPAFWAFLAVSAGVIWRTVRFLLQFPIWGDESFVCVNFLDNSYARLIGPLRVGQICPLPFLWGELALYRLLGPSEWVMRLVPFVEGLAALVLFGLLCRRVVPGKAGLLAIALLAVSYYPVRHAVEVKPYAQDLLVSLALLLPAVLYLNRPDRRGPLVVLSLCVPVAVVSSYPAALVAGAISLTLLPVVWRMPGRAVKIWFWLYNALLLAAFLANYILVGRPQLSPHEGIPNNAFQSTWQEWFPDLDLLSLVWWFLKAHTGNMMAYPVGGPYFASTLTTVLCLVGGWHWWRHGNRQILALLLWLFALSILAAIVHKYPYGGSARLDQHLAPAICLLMGCGIVSLVKRTIRPKRQTKAAAFILCLLAAFGVAGLVRDVIKPFKTTAELWNRTFVRELMAKAGPHDRVVIFNHPQQVRPGVEWYLGQYENVVWNGKIDWNSLDRTGKIWCVEMYVRKPAADPIGAAVAESGRSVRVVESYQSMAPPEHGDEPEFAEVTCFAAEKDSGALEYLGPGHP